MCSMFIPLSHFCEYSVSTTLNHTTFDNQGRDIYKSVIKGYYIFFLFLNIYSTKSVGHILYSDHYVANQVFVSNKLTIFYCHREVLNQPNKKSDS
jgi:hypothetical protein